MLAECKICGKQFYARPCHVAKGWGKYCSIKCAGQSDEQAGRVQALNNRRWASYKKSTASCLVCHKTFTAPPSVLKRGKKYCSLKCSDSVRKGKNAGEKNYGWKGGDVTKKCIVCQKEFKARRDQVRKTGAKFCSLNCRSIYNVRYNHGSQNTDIENIIETSLLKLNIPYEKQVAIEGIALVDFLLPNKNIIQCDGDYWHSLPATKARDERQDYYLWFRGYTVLRLRGSIIKKNLQFCEDTILALTVENRADNVGIRGNR